MYRAHGSSYTYYWRKGNALRSRDPENYLVIGKSTFLSKFLIIVPTAIEP
jgi:hypothetical protein